MPSGGLRRTSSDRAASMEAAAVLRPHPKAAAGRKNNASMLIAGTQGDQTLLQLPQCDSAITEC